LNNHQKLFLIALGIEFPKEYDVSIAFKQISNKKNIPSCFLSMLNELVNNISELAELRGLASYGYEKGINCLLYTSPSPRD